MLSPPYKPYGYTTVQSLAWWQPTACVLYLQPRTKHERSQKTPSLNPRTKNEQSQKTPEQSHKHANNREDTLMGLSQLATDPIAGHASGHAHHRAVWQQHVQQQRLFRGSRFGFRPSGGRAEECLQSACRLYFLHQSHVAHRPDSFRMFPEKCRSVWFNQFWRVLLHGTPSKWCLFLLASL